MAGMSLGAVGQGEEKKKGGSPVLFLVCISGRFIQWVVGSTECWARNVALQDFCVCFLLLLLYGCFLFASGMWALVVGGREDELLWQGFDTVMIGQS